VMSVIAELIAMDRIKLKEDREGSGWLAFEIEDEYLRE